MTNEPVPPHAASENDLSGRQIADYQLLRRLGRGGMADVYLAQQQSLQRSVAFKVLKPGLARDELYVRRFHQEAKAAAALVHANIVQIYEVGCVEGIHFIALEYVAGQNLRQVIGRRGALDAATAVALMLQVTAALHKSASTGIVHRDIKPENILISPAGEVKVTDFGLARVTRGTEDNNLTQIGITMGSPLYMSPEQVEGKRVDPRSDLYSFGITCYHMLAGHPPFQGETSLAIAVQHLKTEPERLEQERGDIPQGLCRIVHKLMAKRPEDRFQTPRDVLKELRSLPIDGLDEQWIGGLDLWSSAELASVADSHFAATQQLDTIMKFESRRRRSRHRIWLIMAAVTLSAFLLGASVAWMTGPASLLQVTPDELRQVNRMPSVAEQYLEATRLGTEAGWRSVAENFPPDVNQTNRYYSLRAKQRLAELYLNRENYDGAARLYGELAALGPNDLHFHLFGLVGQANVLLLEDRVGEAKRKLAEIVGPYEMVRAPEIRAELRQQLDPRLRSEFTTLLRSDDADT